MFFRKYENTQGSAFPEKWQNKINNSFEDFIAKKFKITNDSFYSYGVIHQDELVIIGSLVYQEANKSPLSLFISKDLSQKELEPRELEKVKNTMVDILGIIFNDILNIKDEFEYQPDWQQYEYKKKDYFYKTNRENISLTIEANKILQEN